MDELVKPIVQAFLVCDSVILDSFTRKKSIIGTFTALVGATIPLPASSDGRLFLFDGRGRTV